jgi:DNA-binding LacI/PurR family transcriptional regulator
MDVGSREDRQRALSGTDGCLLTDTVLADDAVWADWLTQIRTFPPTVVLNPGRTLPIPTVGPDDADGCRRLIAGLAKRGHRHLVITGHLRGSRQHGSQSIRHAALLAACAERGMRSEDWSDRTPAEVVRQLASASPRPTALVDMTSSRMPETVIRLTRLGWKLPADLALAQVDDAESARYLLPQITSIAWSIEEYGFFRDCSGNGYV